jgi:hypothetical protein
LKRQEGELGKCHASDYSGNPENVQMGFGVALRARLLLVLALGLAGIRGLL